MMDGRGSGWGPVEVFNCHWRHEQRLSQYELDLHPTNRATRLHPRPH